MTPTPRIGIIGSGAIGGFYGLMLARAGFDVHFLLRSEFAAVASQGLHVNSALHGNLHLDNVQAYQSAADMPPCDWLLIGAKTTSNAELAPLISQAVLHQALGSVNLGYHSGPASDAESRQQILEQGCALFQAAGLDSTAMAELNQARWQKLVWNVPYNGLAVLLNSATTALMGNTDSRALIEAIMQEVADAAGACGYQLPAGFAGKLLAATDRMPDYLPSMYHDFALQRPLELHAIYAAPLAAAAQAGYAMPRTEMLYQTLRFLEQRAQ